MEDNRRINPDIHLQNDLSIKEMITERMSTASDNAAGRLHQGIHSVSVPVSVQL